MFFPNKSISFNNHIGKQNTENFKLSGKHLNNWGQYYFNNFEFNHISLTRENNKDIIIYDFKNCIIKKTSFTFDNTNIRDSDFSLKNTALYFENSTLQYFYLRNFQLTELSIKNCHFKSEDALQKTSLDIVNCDIDKLYIDNSTIEKFKIRLDKNKEPTKIGSFECVSSHFDDFYLHNTIIEKKFSIIYTKLNNIAILNDNIFKREVLLEKTTFKSMLDLTKSSFGNFIDISTSVFNNNIVLNSISFYDGNKKLNLTEYNTYYQTIEKYLKEDKIINFRISMSLFKQNLDKGANYIDANNFYALELRAYENELSKIKFKSIKNFSDWFLFKLNKWISSNYQNTLQAILWWLRLVFYGGFLVYGVQIYLNSDLVDTLTLREIIQSIAIPIKIDYITATIKETDTFKYKADTVIIISLLKIATTYVLWQIIRSAMRNFRR